MGEPAAANASQRAAKDRGISARHAAKTSRGRHPRPRAIDESPHAVRRPRPGPLRTSRHYTARSTMKPQKRGLVAAAAVLALGAAILVVGPSIKSTMIKSASPASRRNLMSVGRKPSLGGLRNEKTLAAEHGKSGLRGLMEDTEHRFGGRAPNFGIIEGITEGIIGDTSDYCNPYAVDYPNGTTSHCNENFLSWIDGSYGGYLEVNVLKVIDFRIPEGEPYTYPTKDASPNAGGSLLIKAGRKGSKAVATDFLAITPNRPFGAGHDGDSSAKPEYLNFYVEVNIHLKPTTSRVSKYTSAFPATIDRIAFGQGSYKGFWRNPQRLVDRVGQL